MVEWTQRPHRPLDQQLSYETEWDMVNAVSFKRKVHTNGEGKAFLCTSLRPDMNVNTSWQQFDSYNEVHCITLNADFYYVVARTCMS